MKEFFMMEGEIWQGWMGWHLWLGFVIFFFVSVFLVQVYRRQKSEKKNLQQHLFAPYQKGELTKDEYEAELRKLN